MVSNWFLVTETNAAATQALGEFAVIGDMWLPVIKGSGSRTGRIIAVRLHHQ